MRRAMDKFVLSPERKEHYRKLGIWLRDNPCIEFKKLSVGFSVDISTIPDDLVEDFLRVATFEGK